MTAKNLTTLISKLDRIDAIYRFAPTVEVLLDLLNSPLSSARDISDHVDPAVASEILRVANSAYYSAGKERVTTIERAILLIGFDTLSQIVLEMFMLSLANGGSKDATREFIQHSLLTAIISKESVSFRAQKADELYLAGLLHDIGKPVICAYFPEAAAEIREAILADHLSEWEAEKLVLGVTHAEIGSIILTKWNFDPTQVATVALHHSTETELPEDVRILMEANRKAKSVRVPFDIFSQDSPPVVLLRNILYGI